MKLSIYLFRDDVTELNGLILPRHLSGEDAFQELQPSQPLPFEVRAFVQPRRVKPPRWVEFLSTGYSLSHLNLHNEFSSFVLLLKAQGRVFALTFGYGFNTLDRTKLEPAFGLRTSLNALDQHGIRTVDTRNIDLVTRQRRTHVNVGSPVSTFDINVNLDWVRFISGKPVDDSVARSVSGSDSLSVSCDCGLAQLGTKCGQLLALYLSETYRQSFAFIDFLRPLRKGDPFLPQLEATLRQRLAERSPNQLAIAYPEIPDPEKLAVFRLSGHYKHVDVDEVSLEAAYRFMDSYPELDWTSDNIWVVGLGGQEEPVTRRRPLRDYLVCEVDLADGVFLFSLGQWFRAKTDFVEEVRAEVAQIEDLTSTLSLPPIHPGEVEASYNARVASEKGWLLLDRGLLHFPKTRDRIEVCDLLSPAGDFVCVKRLKSSATLSHLFSQASVSAQLLRRHDWYRKETARLIGDRWPAVSVDDVLGNARFVYAIPTDRAGTLASCLFLFSLINLVDHVRSIRASNLGVALCKVGYEVTGSVNGPGSP
ncbi:MAG: DUF6119 family protein [Acidobacteriota bacterium]